VICFILAPHLASLLLAPAEVVIPEMFELLGKLSWRDARAREQT